MQLRGVTKNDGSVLKQPAMPHAFRSCTGFRRYIGVAIPRASHSFLRQSVTAIEWVKHGCYLDPRFGVPTCTYLPSHLPRLKDYVRVYTNTVRTHKHLRSVVRMSLHAFRTESTFLETYYLKLVWSIFSVTNGLLEPLLGHKLFGFRVRSFLP